MKCLVTWMALELLLLLLFFFLHTIRKHTLTKNAGGLFLIYGTIVLKFLS